MLYLELFFYYSKRAKNTFRNEQSQNQVKGLKYSIQLGSLNEDKLRNVPDRASVRYITSLCWCTLIGEPMSSIGIPGDRKLFRIQELILFYNTIHA